MTDYLMASLTKYHPLYAVFAEVHRSMAVQKIFASAFRLTSSHLMVDQILSSL